MMIPWRKFIPVGIMAIKTFLSRNKALAKKHALDRQINKDTLRLIYRLEVKKNRRDFEVALPKVRLQ
jgi:hypothetical protein